MNEKFKPNNNAVLPPEATAVAVTPIGAEQLHELTQILMKYKAGKSRTDARIVASENWWKLRNTTEESGESALFQKGFTSRSGWLHNVIVSKHSDAIEAYPEANLLPREESDKAEAKILSSIIPCILEQNHFEKTYDNAMWSKMKCGTAVYKIVWDKNKLNGLGDINIECISVLNLFFEPGITDIQKSRYVFHTELIDKDILQEKYPEQLKAGVKGDAFITSTYLYDDNVDTQNKATVIECYYHKHVNGKKTLQYVKYVGDKVLYATENDNEPVMGFDGIVRPPLSISGLYDHAKYPYVFDVLYPIEGSPCGYGYVDVCRNPQTEIDLLKTSFIRNARVGAIPRYFSRGTDGINEEEFLDLSKPLVHVNDLSELALRPIDHKPIDGSYFNLLQWDVNELRETSGNTEASTGTAPSGVTSASGIAALQEASGKGSRASTMTSYRAYTEIVDFCVELIRQFYEIERKFRIIGENGAAQFVSYSNAGIKPQHQGVAFDEDTGYRLPVFDIKVTAQKKSTYTKIAQNELSLQFFRLGFFNPQMVDQALMCIGMMDFDGKDEVQQKIAQNGTMYQKLVQYMQMALQMSQTVAPQMSQQILQDLMATTGGKIPMGSGAMPALPESDNIAGIKREEHGIPANARAKARDVAQPDGGAVIASRGA